MSDLNNLETALTRMPVIAIIRGGERIESTLKWLAETPVEVVEVTTNTPDWQDAVALASSLAFSHVGVGTVVSTSHVREAHRVGAAFTVAPGLDADVVGACQQVGLEHVPGVTTPSEIQAAMRLGVSTMKLFPAGPLGTGYLRALRAPFDNARFIPTGGVSIDTAPEWLAAGAFAVGVGGALSASSDAEIAAVGRQLEELVRGQGSHP